VHSLQPRLLTACLAATQVLSSSAQQPPAPPKFTAGTELVARRFRGQRQSGSAGEGLSATDFVVRETGKERPIVSFVAFAGDEPPAPPNVDVGGRPAGTGCRTRAPATVLLVDDAQLSPSRRCGLRPDLKALLAKMA